MFIWAGQGSLGSTDYIPHETTDAVFQELHGLRTLEIRGRETRASLRGLAAGPSNRGPRVVPRARNCFLFMVHRVGTERFPVSKYCAWPILV